MELTQIQYNTSAYTEMIALRNRILRIPLGMLLSDKEIQQEKDDIFIGCYTNGATQLMGCCILSRMSPTTMQLRQMAVDHHWQQQGVGSRILLFAEKIAATQGYRYVYLHARKTARLFYTKHGYSIEGDVFFEVGIAHYEMLRNIENVAL